MIPSPFCQSPPSNNTGRTCRSATTQRSTPACRRHATVLALPMQSVGLSVEHMRFPGTLTLSAETLIAVLTEIGRSVARAGVQRLVILNSHGGQPQVVDIVCGRLRGDGTFAVG
jgi:creatinine amidohydrolase/Fe(II)-dependent formamide hydrolase-like protein